MHLTLQSRPLQALAFAVLVPVTTPWVAAAESAPAPAPAGAPAALLRSVAAPRQDDTALPDIKDEIDLSVRWLRQAQDRTTGAYGAGVDGTAWALYALAVGPRHYTSVDGPFVADAVAYLLARQSAEGWIADDGANDALRLAQTSRAAAALSVHVNAQTGAALGKAVKWLTGRGIEQPDLGLPTVQAADRERLVATTLQLLHDRAADWSWDGPDGKVVTTSRNIALLARYRPIIEPAHVKASSARALPKFDAARRAEADAAVLKGARFLVQASVGGDHARWGAPGKPDAGLSAMVAGALQAVPEPRPADVQGAIDDVLAWLCSLQHEDGSIHTGFLANYVTSAAVLALARQEGNEERIARARDFLVKLQADEEEGYSPDSPFYGGVGYGDDERTDLSNMQSALEALHTAGLPLDDPAWQRAVIFLQRCQNRSESNDYAVEQGGVTIHAGDDGGGWYAPGMSKAGNIQLPDGTEVPRSYGSMSYALLRGYVFSGLKKADPRVQAVWKWLQENYTLDVNPGYLTTEDPTEPYRGLFYYFHTMAKALDLFGEEVIVDGAGVSHSWRPELAGRLIAMQSKADGSWVNVNAPGWWEGNPVLATAYALISLDAARPKE
ncbi:MAG: hypothetical protein R3F49_17220 [Planctomycetota bacterium]